MTENTPGSSTSELLQAISADLSALVRQELQQAQRELADKAKAAGAAGAMLGGAAALGTLAVGSSATLFMRLLERRLGRPGAAAVATLLFGGGAAALGTAGLAALREAWPLAPRDTVASVREDIRMANNVAGTPPPPPAG